MNAIVDNKHFVNPASVKSGFRIDQADRLTINGALLHKSGFEHTSPFPGWTYPTGSVTGMPRAV